MNRTQTVPRDSNNIDGSRWTRIAPASIYRRVGNPVTHRQIVRRQKHAERNFLIRRLIRNSPPQSQRASENATNGPPRRDLSHAKRQKASPSVQTRQMRATVKSCFLACLVASSVKPSSRQFPIDVSSLKMARDGENLMTALHGFHALLAFAVFMLITNSWPCFPARRICHL